MSRLWRLRLCLARQPRLLGLGGICVAVWILGWGWVRNRAGEPSAALDDRWYASHRVVDRHGNLLRELPGTEGRRGRTLELADIGDRLLVATLAAEDEDFFEHDGVDRVAIARAIAQNTRHGRLLSGASTISQQLVKLLDSHGHPHARTWQVKLREAARAQNLEATTPKTTILEAYLNRLPYGHGCIGPDAAARTYFGVPSPDLSWAQAAFLAVIPRAPSRLDPYREFAAVERRQQWVLDQLHRSGVLDEATWQRASHETISLRPIVDPFAAPHFVQALVDEERLADAETTRTTLDTRLQVDVEGLVTTHLATIVKRRAANAAVLVIDNRTGDIMAWVGSADFENDAIAGQVDMIRANRQPGSTLKPFVYALAFERGDSASTMVADIPTEFVERHGQVYAPRNFERSFVGPISAREALASSLNVPAVRIASQLGADTVLRGLHDLGLASLDRDANHYGLSLALGSGEVQLRELAAAYVALARGGEFVELRYRADDPPALPRRVLSPASAALVTDALSDPLARLRLLDGARSPFDIGFPVAAKTGTSSGFHDAWAAGFTAERTVAVWVGNANATAMQAVTGASGAGPLFADVMRRAMRDVSSRRPLWDADVLVARATCPLSGLPAGPECPAHVERWFDPSHAPTQACDLHRRVSAHAARWRCDPSSDAVAVVLPQAFDTWLRTHGPERDADGLRWLSETQTDGCRPQPIRPTLTMTSPADGTIYLYDAADSELDRVRLSAGYEGPADSAPQSVEFVVDGVVVAESAAPYQALVDMVAGDHDVYARPSDPTSAIALGGSHFSSR